jgi:hypothetical protein
LVQIEQTTEAWWWLENFNGTVCAGLLNVVGPASSKRTQRFASAAARRPAMTHAAVPHVTIRHPQFSGREMRRFEGRLKIAHRL